MVILPILVAGLIGEIWLRHTCAYCSWTENNGRPYRDPYLPNVQSWYHVRGANWNGSYNLPEFNFDLATNSLGIRDIEHPLNKPVNEYRILAMGEFIY